MYKMGFIFAFLSAITFIIGIVESFIELDTGYYGSEIFFNPTIANGWFIITGFLLITSVILICTDKIFDKMNENSSLTNDLLQKLKKLVEYEEKKITILENTLPESKTKSINKSFKARSTILEISIDAANIASDFDDKTYYIEAEIAMFLFYYYTKFLFFIGNFEDIINKRRELLIPIFNKSNNFITISSITNVFESRYTNFDDIKNKSDSLSKFLEVISKYLNIIISIEYETDSFFVGDFQNVSKEILGRAQKNTYTKIITSSLFEILDGSMTWDEK